MIVGRSEASAAFRKTGSPEKIRLEMVKTTMAGEVGSSSGQFYCHGSSTPIRSRGTSNLSWCPDSAR